RGEPFRFTSGRIVAPEIIRSAAIGNIRNRAPVGPWLYSPKISGCKERNRAAVPANRASNYVDGGRLSLIVIVHRSGQEFTSRAGPNERSQQRSRLKDQFC